MLACTVRRPQPRTQSWEHSPAPPVSSRGAGTGRVSFSTLKSTKFWSFQSCQSVRHHDLNDNLESVAGRLFPSSKRSVIGLNHVKNPITWSHAECFSSHH